MPRVYNSPTVRRIIVYLALGITAGLLTLIFYELAEQLLEDELVAFDDMVLYYLQQWAGSSDAVVMMMRGITRLGDGIVQTLLCVIVCAVLWLRGSRRNSTMLALCLSGGWVLNYTLKAWFGRERPGHEFLVDAAGFSFPSGHAMVSICFYGMLGYLLYRRLRGRWPVSWLFPAAALSLAIAIGVSRVYLGVHYASDVIAGLAAGGIWLISCIISLKLLRLYR
ncbi:hypothetical protein PA598K_03624 [Paenibacillus sp. 598K]|uniref:phosphatase PAP2 family protein n=1 Tax=Paenibacillus sp. 598K TaxID=1117987 RepID=UPI000FFA0C3F|nr:phosphatase PAP2 family protein [Paenibacillus sp. 598K]GBF75234.1 hypothetical protein PA598K_03624 [Paenibacillus sp. 598K]